MKLYDLIATSEYFILDLDSPRLEVINWWTGAHYKNGAYKGQLLLGGDPIDMTRDDLEELEVGKWDVHNGTLSVWVMDERA